MTNYSTHCPDCDSQDIEMIGDSKYNDLWICETCKSTFSTFVQKEEKDEFIPNQN